MRGAARGGAGRALGETRLRVRDPTSGEWGKGWGRGHLVSEARVALADTSTQLFACDVAPRPGAGAGAAARRPGRGSRRAQAAGGGVSCESAAPSGGENARAALAPARACASAVLPLEMVAAAPRRVTWLQRLDEAAARRVEAAVAALDHDLAAAVMCIHEKEPAAARMQAVLPPGGCCRRSASMSSRFEMRPRESRAWAGMRPSSLTSHVAGSSFMHRRAKDLNAGRGADVGPTRLRGHSTTTTASRCGTASDQRSMPRRPNSAMIVPRLQPSSPHLILILLITCSVVPFSGPLLGDAAPILEIARDEGQVEAVEGTGVMLFDLRTGAATSRPWCVHMLHLHCGGHGLVTMNVDCY